jgi:hypothetical protein
VVVIAIETMAAGGDHSGSRRYALHDDDDNATDDALGVSYLAYAC